MCVCVYVNTIKEKEIVNLREGEKKEGGKWGTGEGLEKGNEREK